MKSSITCERGTGNVYKDLGFPDAEELQAKAILVSRIMSIIEKKGWSQERAAEILGLTQPKISLLSRGQFSGFSIEKLFNLLQKLNQDVQIVIKARKASGKKMGHLSVIFGNC